MVVIPVLLALLDLAIIVIAIQCNDTVCRDAARAASAGRPATFTPASGPARAENANERAQGVVNRAKIGLGGYIKDLRIVGSETGPTPAAPTGPDPSFGGP